MKNTVETLLEDYVAKRAVYKSILEFPEGCTLCKGHIDGEDYVEAVYTFKGKAYAGAKRLEGKGTEWAESVILKAIKKKGHLKLDKNV